MDNAFQVVRAKFRKSASAQNLLIKDISHPLKYFIFDVDTKFSTLSELCLLFGKFVPLPIKFVNLNTPNSSLKNYHLPSNTFPSPSVAKTNGQRQATTYLFRIALDSQHGFFSYFSHSLWELLFNMKTLSIIWSALKIPNEFSNKTSRLIKIFQYLQYFQY